MLRLNRVNELIVGAQCLSSQSDPKAGLSLKFKGSDRVEAPDESAEPDDFAGYQEATLLILCNWVIYQNDEALLGWETAGQLVGSTVHRMKFMDRNLDFFIDLSDANRLYVYTDQEKLSYNYMFQFGELYWAVSAGGKVRQQSPS